MAEEVLLQTKWWENQKKREENEKTMEIRLPTTPPPQRRTKFARWQPFCLLTRILNPN